MKQTMLSKLAARPLPWCVGETHETMSHVMDAKGNRVCCIRNASHIFPGFSAEELAEMLCLYANTTLAAVQSATRLEHT
jgi:hypothetical protein